MNFRGNNNDNDSLIVVIRLVKGWYGLIKRKDFDFRICLIVFLEGNSFE